MRWLATSGAEPYTEVDEYSITNEVQSINKNKTAVVVAVHLCVCDYDILR